MVLSYAVSSAKSLQVRGDGLVRDEVRRLLHYKHESVEAGLAEAGQVLGEMLDDECRERDGTCSGARLAAALGESGPGLTMARTLVTEGAKAAEADFLRFYGEQHPELVEAGLRDSPTGVGANQALAERLRALHDLPDGTLGHEYVEFYRRNGIALPGDDPSMPEVFVAHDMCHVIAGYEPTGQGEIALGAMQLALSDTDPHWVQFLGNLAVHEAGFLGGGVIPKTATLTRDGAIDMLARAFWRGSQCTGDFTTVDHLALVESPVVEVRAQLGVPPL